MSAAPEALTRPQADLLRLRLHNQRLGAASCERVEDVVAWLGAVQSQDYAAATWAIGLRAPDATAAAVAEAFDAGTILRTHVLRPTWHCVTPADIRWIISLSAPRVHAFNRSYYRKYELDAATLTRSRRTIERALSTAVALTRSEIAAALGRAGIEADGVRLALLMMHAELEGVVCSGPRRGKQFTYALLDSRAPEARTLPRDEALEALTRRYFSSHGPATIRDFAWWSGLSVADARTGIAMARPALQATTLDQVTYWFTSSLTSTHRSLLASHLLPNFDEFLIAYQDRSLAVPLLQPELLKTTSESEFAHPVIVKGRLAGSWRRRMRGDSTTVEVKPRRAFGPSDTRALSAAARRYSRFLGAPVDLIFVK